MKQGNSASNYVEYWCNVRTDWFYLRQLCPMWRLISYKCTTVPRAVGGYFCLSAYELYFLSSDLCPVGALTSKPYAFTARPWELRYVLLKHGLLLKSLPFTHVFQCLCTFMLISALFWLVEIWQLSRWGATRELEVEFKFQRSSGKLSFFFLPRCQSVPESLLAGYWF